MKQLEGVVTSVKMEKTVTVKVERRKMHRLYGKSIKQTKKYHAACEQQVQEGDKVRMMETRPRSKTKRWKVMEVVE